jgi:hypothetical protein
MHVENLMRILPVLFCGLGLSLAASSVFAADAKTKPSALQGMYACSTIEDDAERLACFDGAVSKIKSAEASGEIVAVNSQQIQNLEREAFGFDLPSLPKLRIPTLSRLTGLAGSDGTPRPSALDDGSEAGGEVLATRDNGEITKIGFDIDRYRKKANGRYKFYLANGQSWEQVDDARVWIPRSAPKLVAEIRRAAMGSYLLRINGEGRAIRVRRTK